MHLLVGIDTESDNQWDLAARERPTFENLYALPALHALFRRHGVRPTYVITWPVAKEPRSADVLRALRESHTCEIGAHHHAWETPPCAPEDMRRHPYAADLPISQFEAQLTALTEAIADAVGERPVSYRSGRFGFAAAHVAPLERAGYRIESSVTPLFYEGHKRGPDFADAPLRPYYLAYDHPTRPGTSQLLELPLSSALNRRVPHALAMAWARAPRNYQTKRILRKLGHRARAVAAPVVLVARRHEAARAPPRRRRARRSSTCCSTRARRSSAEAPTIARRPSSTRSSIASIAFSPSRRASCGAEPLTFSEFRDRFVARRALWLQAFEPASLRTQCVRILHVTPHLPPDQAANALLSGASGTLGRDAGDEVSYLAHPPRAGEPAATAGPVDLDPAGAVRGLARWLRLDSLAAARRIARLAGPLIDRADLVHLHSNGLLTEVVSWLAARRGRPCVLTLYGTEIWHYRRKRAAGSVHAHVPSAPRT